MPFNREKVKAYLQQGDFESLFIEELGWDNETANQTITIDDNNIELQAVAEKCGLITFICNFHRNGDIPDYKTRLKIDKQLTKQVNQHLIIFTSPDGNRQYWQWMRQETGKSAALRGQNYEKQQGSEILLQKLQQLYFSLEEESNISVVSGRMQSAFDLEKLTKKFYDRFKKERDNFLNFIEGIPDNDLIGWYTSVIINRLMFIYFLQYKGFLNDDLKYLRTKLQEIKNNRGGNYYKKFLCPLFFEGFAKMLIERDNNTADLLGRIPYLNGGLFLRHEIEEKYGDSINIKDEAFENLFNFFDKYQWHLDERPLKDDYEINPDVLGYIFEKYINQKQMGAYYTQEDITEYISKNTLIPWLFNSAAEDCKNAFTPNSHLWKLLKDNPDRYIYTPVRNSSDKILPKEIAEGLNDISKRKAWNSPSGDDGLPSEIWRETIARRKHYEEIKDKISKGEIHTIEDLITYNLDIKQFARDAIQYAEGADSVRAFWDVLHKIKVLDPACGSGAFLFSALNILEELYETCLDKMQFMIDEMPKSNEPQYASRLSGFKEILEEIKKHPNRAYFIYKTIIVQNIYGVDIIEEGVEICKLRLFLKLAAQLEPTDEIEPLPDIDFNIKHGNSLVGYTDEEDLQESTKEKLPFDSDWQVLQNKVGDLAKNIEEFRGDQIHENDEIDHVSKSSLMQDFNDIREELSQYLAEDYGKKQEYKNWNEIHKPFHWWLEFHDIIDAGGFHVIIGNPPYLEKREVDYDILSLQTEKTKAIHAMFIEKCIKIIHREGNMSMIVPLSIVSTQRMQIVQNILENNRSTWYAHYSWRPAKLFDKVNRALTIFISCYDGKPKTYSTNYQRWSSNNREDLMEKISLMEIPHDRNYFWAPKLGQPIEKSILQKLITQKNTIEFYLGRSDHKIFYRSSGGLYWKVFTDFSPKFIANGKERSSSKEAMFSVSEKKLIYPIIAILSSNVFWYWYTITSNLRDLAPIEIKNFPLSESAVNDTELEKLGEAYVADIDKNSKMLTRMQKTKGKTETQEFKIKKSKHIIDEIDKVLAKHYGFTDEELDFIINYDIKFRMGLLKKNNQ